MPGGYVVGEAGDGLEFDGFEGCAGNLRFGGVLRWVEKAAEGDGDLFAEDEAEFAGEVMLTADPRFICGRSEIEDGVAPDRRRGKAGDEPKQRFPLESGIVGVFHRGRDGIEERHVQELVYRL